MIAAYEKRIAQLEREKLRLAEQQKATQGQVRTFGEVFELALEFLSNPLNLWRTGRLEDRQTVLKPVSSAPLAYTRKTGFRTQKTSPFSMP